MGLRINVYRPAGRERGPDLSNRVDHLTVMNIAGPAVPSADAPAVRLEVHLYYHDLPLIVPDVPPESDKRLRGPMAGNNYAGCPDSKWMEAVALITGVRGDPLVRVHDRYEEGAE